MKYTGLLIRIFYLTFIGLVLCGCEDEVQTGRDNSQAGKELYDAYISIYINRLSESPQLRANPTGGEEGDGSEEGQVYENAISNLTVVLFDGNDLNNALNNEVSAVIYIDSDNIQGNVTTVQKVTLERNIYNILVFANIGNISTQLEGMTVKEVCDYLQQTAWKETNGTFSDFVMTSANEATVNLTLNTTETFPAIAFVDIQHMAARIDIIPNQGENNTNLYTVTDGNTAIAGIRIDRVKLMNRLTAGSFMIKRVAEDINNMPVYLGSETPQSGNQTNYVLDPWIGLKTADNLSGGHFDLTSGGIGSSAANLLYADYFEENFMLNSDNDIETPLSGYDYYILGYTLENTMEKDNQLNGYTTGVMYQATYIPYLITAYDAASGANEIIQNTEEVTFFTIRNNTFIYNTLESVEFPFLSDSQTNDFFAQAFSTANTWADIQAYAERIRDQDILGYKQYLDSLLAGRELTDNIDRNISWSLFVLNTYGYTVNDGTVLINQNNLDTKTLLKSRDIKMYDSGICYYPYWIRHSNDNTIESAIMEFGIVRNNIYKLRVESFSGLGKPDPYDPDTDSPGNPDEESYVRVWITVKPWRLITHPEIIL